MAGGGAWLLLWLLELIDRAPSGGAATMTLAAFGALAMLFGFIGLHARHSATTRPLSLVGLAVGALGLLLCAFAASRSIGLVLAPLGLMAMGIAYWRAAKLPAWCRPLPLVMGGSLAAMMIAGLALESSGRAYPALMSRALVPFTLLLFFGGAIAIGWEQWRAAHESTGADSSQIRETAPTVEANRQEAAADSKEKAGASSSPRRRRRRRR
jgi:hypothetical protein